MRPSFAGLAAALLAFAVAAVCIRLGFWQLDRLQERRDRNEAIASAMLLPTLQLPESLSAVMRSPDAYVYRRVAAVGTFDLENEVVVRGRAEGGRPGVHLVSPLIVSGDTAVLVNRGWVPSEDALTVNLRGFQERGTRRVEGILMAPPRVDEPVELVIGSPTGPVRTFARIPLYRLAGDAARPLLPLYIQQGSEPDSSVGVPLRLGIPQLDEGPHMGYAVQWFSFAGVAILGVLVVYLRGRSRSS